jgi:hypothetical protein
LHPFALLQLKPKANEKRVKNLKAIALQMLAEKMVVTPNTIILPIIEVKEEDVITTMKTEKKYMLTTAFVNNLYKQLKKIS